jgi:pyruvate ferredoxin oxidoreductase gamma subunit
LLASRNCGENRGTKRRLGVLEIRFHGRGGQGAVTSAELVALAAIDEGKFAQSIPAFGPERRGAPVLAFARISEGEPIRVRTPVTRPDVSVVLDSGLLRVVDVTEGMKDGGLLIINSTKSPEELRAEFDLKGYPMALVDATTIARETLGLPITNTTMVGALVKATGLVEVESLVEPFTERFGRLAEKNLAAMRRAYDETLVEEVVA